jgi:S1-C subfamily serine protease
LVAVAGKPVTTIDELMAVLEDHKVGEQVTVEFLRGNRREKITVTLQAVN